MMNLQVLPQRLAFLSSAGAFVLTWVTGLISEVPVHRISLRAVAGAAVFWVIGLVVGKVFLNNVCDALSEQMYSPQDEEKPRSGGRK